MTTDEAADLAARTLAAIDKRAAQPVYAPSQRQTFAADRERVTSDLAGLREHMPCDAWAAPGDCYDARRYADGLRRSAALYGVTS